MGPCILWDWNGTLLDDTEAALATLNEMIAARGGRPIALPFYRDHFAFPVRPFYGTIGIAARGEDEWNAVAREYHEVYARQPKALNPDAVAALEAAKAAGCEQAVVSALRQDLLERDLAAYGVRGYFAHVCGTDNLDGASKVARARVLLRTLRSERAERPFVLVGDALHDKEVADALGVPCVLCAQGSHAAWRLRAVAPTCDTLGEAVRLALQLTVA